MHGSYAIRNYGRRTLYFPDLDTNQIAAHRLDEPILSIELRPNEPAAFRIGPDRNMDYPDGVVIRFRRSLKSKKIESQYVRLPEPLQRWDGASGKWEMVSE